MSLLDICICIIFLLIGFNLKNFFKGFSQFDKKTLNILFLYHIAIAFVFHFYVSGNGGDALHYWEAPVNNSLSSIVDLVKGRSASGVMYLINYFPSKVLGLSFLTGNIIYATFGFLGFIYLFKVIKYFFPSEEILSQIRLFKIPIFPWIWFLPNFHFWTSGIGKDTLLFTAIIIFIYGLTNIRKHLFIVGFSMLIAIMIRPHILLFLFVSFGIGFILDGRLKSYQKVVLFFIFLVGFASIFNFVLQFIQLESLESSAISEYTANKSSGLNKIRTGSGVDISGYPFIIKVFTFLYRPFFFDINGVLAILASVENLILFIFSGLVLIRKPFLAFRKSGYLLKGSIFFFIIGSLAFSLILGNLGIMLRQKNMLMPWLVVFGVWTLYLYQQRKYGNEGINSY
jgi:hypothetical protein